MLTLMFVSFGHAALGVVIALVVGGVLGFAFRGKESAIIHNVESKTQAGLGNVAKKL